MGFIDRNVNDVLKLTCPSELAYGAKGTTDGVIPPNATIQFTIEVLDC